MASFFKKFVTVSSLVASLAIAIVAPVAQATTYIVPEITSDSIAPNPFNPYVENATLEYNINYASNVRVEIFNSSNTTVATLVNEYQDFGWHTAIWDGSDYSNSNGPWAAEGTYRYEIYIWNDAGLSDSVDGYFQVDYNNGRGGHIFNFDVDSSFEIGEDNIGIDFSLDYAASTLITVREDNGSYVDTILDEYKQDGSYSYTWDGRDSSGRLVSPGYFDIQIQTTDTNGNLIDSETLETRGFDFDGPNGDGPDITNLDVIPSTFNPDREDTQIRFTIDEAALVTVTIENRSGDVIETIIDENKEEGRYTFYWDGRDYRNREVNEGSYEVHVNASNYFGSDEEEETVRVDYDYNGGGIPYPPYPRPGFGCAGFVDVAPGSELCDAVSFTRDMGIFDGYRDGTFRPEQPINRAEVTKVLVEAFDIDIMAPNGTNLGLVDLDPRAWYMPYIRTAKRFGIVQGYPDRTFRPSNTMNRAELVKTFLTTSGIAMPTCVGAPYADTPNNPITGWYIDFACFSKAHNLISTFNGMFEPTRPVTRGEVAIMFYRFERQGLFARSVTPPIDAR